MRIHRSSAGLMHCHGDVCAHGHGLAERKCAIQRCGPIQPTDGGDDWIGDVSWPSSAAIISDCPGPGRRWAARFSLLVAFRLVVALGGSRRPASEQKSTKPFTAMWY